MISLRLVICIARVASFAAAQTFQRLGACPDLGCIFPPDEAEFLPGVFFDLRVEVHAIDSASHDEEFSLTVTKEDGTVQTVEAFFGCAETPKNEQWSFKYFKDLFARDLKQSTSVDVTSKIFRQVSFEKPGTYIATLTHHGKTRTVANWHVLPKPVADMTKTAKNVILFIGDGMTTNMITAARLIGFKSVNGKYKRSADGYRSNMALDNFPHLGHQMTHSLDSFITDSANSATAMYTGHKASVDALSVYADSSPDSLDDPKMETIAELFRRKRGGRLGIVTTAFLADATPAALVAHTRKRQDYMTVIESLLLSAGANGSWPMYESADVIMGGGSELFLKPGSKSKDPFYDQFKNAGYQVVLDETSMKAAPTRSKTLGVFCKGDMSKWLDRNIYKDNLKGMDNDPSGKAGDALDQPGLASMTLKAIDILHHRDGANGNKGFFLMSEAGDWDRMLAELLELDETIKLTIEKLKTLGILDDTLIITTADHGHGFDVWGSVDTEYFDAQKDELAKKEAIGPYEKSGHALYADHDGKAAEGYPTEWEPRYTLAQGVAAHPDMHENFKLTRKVSGIGFRNLTYDCGDGKDNQGQCNGIWLPATLPASEKRGVHSLTDVAIFSRGPSSHLFSGVMQNVDIFFKMAWAMDLV